MSKYFYRIIMFFVIGLFSFICFSARIERAEAAFSKLDGQPTGGDPAGFGLGVTFVTTPGATTYMAIPHGGTPFVSIYKRDGDTFTKLDNPGDLPPGDGKGASFSADGTYLAVANITESPYVTIYKRDGDAFLKLGGQPTGGFPAGSAYGASFSPDGTYLAIAHTGSPYVTIYKRDGDAFSKLSNPGVLPGGDAQGAAFSPDGTYLAIGHIGTPFVTIYKNNGDDTFTKLTPTGNPAGDGKMPSFSPDGIYLAIAHFTSPYVTIYKISDGDTFTKLPDPAAPAGPAFGASFSPDGTYLAIGHNTTPFVTIYYRSEDTFTKLTDPDILPLGNGRGVSFSPDGIHLAVQDQSAPFVTIYKVSSISVTSANNAGGATTLVINKSPETIANDVMIANISVRGGTGTTITGVPSGWTEVRKTDSTTVLKHATYWKAATASEPASYTWTFSSSQKASGGIMGYRGVDNTSPINAENGQANASSADIIAPSITTTVDNTMLVFGGGTAVGTTVSSYPSGLSKRFEDASTGAGAASRTTTTGGDEPKETAGLTGTRTVTMTAAAVNIGHLLALKLAPTLPADPQIQSTTHTDGAKSNVAIATFTCTAGTPTPDHYHYLWDQTASHTKAEVSAGTQWDGTTLNKTCTSDGDWYLHAISHDASHNESTNIDTFHIDYDGTAPEAVTTLSALTGTYSGEIELSWTSPGDDGWNNDFDSGSEFDIRYSTTAGESPAISTTTFSACSSVSEFSPIPTPVTALWPYSMTVTGLTPGTTYYFAMKTADEVLNWSGLSNGATAMAKIAEGANRYWVGVSNPDTWDDANNWSATSGGGGGAGVPGADDTAIFDGGNTYSCQIDISSTVASVIIYSTYTATISINSGKSLTTSGSFEIAGGTFTTNGELLEVGSYTQTGGIFNAGGSTITCNSNFSVTVGTFNVGASVLVLDATDGDATFTGDGYTFNNVIFQSTGTAVRTWTLGGGTITFNGDFQLKAQGTANLTVTAITNNPDLDIGGSVDYIGTGTGSESISMGDGTWTVGGNVDFSDGTVDASTSTFVLNGTSTQTLTMDGNSLNILQITNSSSDGVYFADNLLLSTFTATTGNTQLYFCGGSTFTFTHIELDGQAECIVLRSTSTGTAWYLTVTGNQSVSYVDVEDSDASGGDTILAIDGTSVNSGNNINWDFGPPAAITDLTGLCDSETGDVTLSWSTPGDDEWTGTLPSGSEYRIDYSTYSKSWDKDTYEVSISTSGVAPYTEVSRTITGLTGDSTWYFRIWTADEIPNWSGLSNGATIWVNPILSVSISTDTYNFGTVDCATSTVSGSTTTVINDGNVTETYSIKCSSTTKWTPQDTPGQDEFTLQSAFHSSEPADNDLIWKTDDILTESLQTCTTAAFSIDGTEHGKEVLPFDANTRKLWFRLKTPLSTSTTDQQNIIITISAEQSP